jgi:hypothetical protein
VLELHQNLLIKQDLVYCPIKISLLFHPSFRLATIDGATILSPAIPGYPQLYQHLLRDENVVALFNDNLPLSQLEKFKSSTEFTKHYKQEILLANTRELNAFYFSINRPFTLHYLPISFRHLSSIEIKSIRSLSTPFIVSISPYSSVKGASVNFGYVPLPGGGARVIQLGSDLYPFIDVEELQDKAIAHNIVAEIADAKTGSILMSHNNNHSHQIEVNGEIVDLGFAVMSSSIGIVTLEKRTEFRVDVRVKDPYTHHVDVPVMNALREWVCRYECYEIITLD